MRRVSNILKKVVISISSIALIISGINITNINTMTVYADQSQTFRYTGGVQSFTASESGDYRIEAYGASGLRANAELGGLGGKSEATVYLEKNQTIYICVGQEGASGRTGYNGGGYDGGGGATHVAFSNHGTLNNYASFKEDIILVAGGGGGAGAGASRSGVIGNGGGEQGGTSSIFAYSGSSMNPATQTSGYSFGKGQNNINNGGAGGGGYYGGNSSATTNGGGGGGSGYVSKAPLVMNQITQFSQHSGDGYASISYIGRHKSQITLYNYGACSINGNSDEKIIIEGYSGDIATLTLSAKQGYDLEYWNRVGGDCTIVDLTHIKFGLINSTVTLEFMAPLVVNVSKTSATSPIFKATFKQADNKEKVFRAYESYDGTEWYEADVVSNGPNIRRVNEDITFSSVGVNTYAVKYGGVYTLELYGASGGGSYAQGRFKNLGGSGGYTRIDARLKAGDVLYIAVGGAGSCSYGHNTSGGWNGGGSATDDGGDDETSGSGGGATHIALNSNRGVLSNYASYQNEILAVAGGGGGSSYTYSGGSGGGITGGSCYTGRHNAGQYVDGSEAAYALRRDNNHYNGAFGQGMSGWGVADSDGVAGGGGGWYGGCVHNISYKSGAGGGSGHIGNQSCIEYGETYSSSNRGNGRCRLRYTDTSISATNGETTVEIKLRDKAAPNLPTNGGIIDTTSVGWSAPSDNGSTVYHKIVSYLKSTEAKLRESNVTTDYVETGVVGYYYIVDSNSSTIVTKTNSSYTTSTQCGYTQRSYMQYCHVAAVDGAGNLGNTYTFEIPVGVTIVFNVNNTTNNIYGDVVTTTGIGNTPSQVVTPGSTHKIRTSNFSKTGYVFSHWNTKSDNTGTVFNANQEVQYAELFQTYGARLDLYAIWVPIQYKVHYKRGLTSDVINKNIAGATRNTDIQQETTVANLPYVQTRFDSALTFATIGSVLGREYTVTFDANLPKDIAITSNPSSYKIASTYATTEKSINTVNTGNPIKYTVHQYLLSDNKWKIEGADSNVVNNLIVTMGVTVQHPNYTTISR